jgi:hypothetical protein
MSSEIQTSRNRLLVGITILVILIAAVVIALVLSIRQRPEGPRIGQRSPVAELEYCGTEARQLCIVSFSQIVDGDMQVNIQTPRVFYPRIVLAINRYGVESTYECGKEDPLSHNVECVGPPQVPGELLQFKVIFKEQGTLVAEGKIAIIGIALSTPEILGTTTPEGLATETPTEFPTLGAPTRTPIATQTAPATSSPNPSYPNPSYP